jgi:hypothetical protein
MLAAILVILAAMVYQQAVAAFLFLSNIVVEK